MEPRRGDRLQGGREAQLVWQKFGGMCGLKHRAATEIVRQKASPELFADHLRRLGTQHIQSHRDFDGPEIQLGLPTPTIQLADFLGAETLVRPTAW